MATDQHAFPVVYDHDLVGLVCMNDVRKVPHERWPFTSVSEIMTPTAELSILSQNESAEQALEALALRDIDQIPILDGPHILGLVRRSDIVKWIALQGAPS
jgi:CBS domain-containing protein